MFINKLCWIIMFWCLWTSVMAAGCQLRLSLTVTNPLTRCYPQKSCRSSHFTPPDLISRFAVSTSASQASAANTSPLFPLWSNLSCGITILLLRAYWHIWVFSVYMYVFLISNCSWHAPKSHHYVCGNWREGNKIPSAFRTVLENSADVTIITCHH